MFLLLSTWSSVASELSIQTCRVGLTEIRLMIVMLWSVDDENYVLPLQRSIESTANRCNSILDLSRLSQYAHRTLQPFKNIGEDRNRPHEPTSHTSHTLKSYCLCRTWIRPGSAQQANCPLGKGCIWQFSRDTWRLRDILCHFAKNPGGLFLHLPNIPNIPKYPS